MYNFMRLEHPEFFEIVQHAQDINYGEIEVKMKVREGIVSHMSLWSGKSWSRGGKKNKKEAQNVNHST